MNNKRSLIPSVVSASLRTNLMTGVLVIAPIGVVAWIVVWAWGLLSGLSELLPVSLHPRALFGLENPWIANLASGAFDLVVLALVVSLVWTIGLVSRNYLGRKILDWIRSTLARLPVLSTVYSTLEQLLKTFASGQAKNFRKVVVIEYPRKGLSTLAFVTGERETDPLTGKHARFLNVYIPTTPNPTSGFYLWISADEAHETSITVEEALKEIISMGIVQKPGHE